jgi:hypothetical protein
MLPSPSGISQLLEERRELLHVVALTAAEFNDAVALVGVVAGGSRS